MNNSKHGEYLLAGDIGGTKTALALYEMKKGPLSPLVEKTVPNDSFSGLDAIVESFLQQNSIDPQYACFGAAGPVRDNCVSLTNRDWTIDGEQLQKSFNLRSVQLINDLVATAMGAVHLPEESLHTLNHGERNQQGAVAVIAPGTGLGEAFMIHDGEQLMPYPSEGGHSLFSPADARQAGLWLFLQEKDGPVTAEHACSGLGIPKLYEFLSTEIDEPPELAVRRQEADDTTRFIVEEAMENGDKSGAENCLPVETMHLFAQILAGEAANLTLKVMGTGGLYIGGGIPPRILPFLAAHPFMESFARGVHREMLSRVPVHVILEPKTALIGAAAYGIAMHKRKTG